MLDNYTGGVSVGGDKIKNLRYADDAILLAENTKKLTEMLQLLTHECHILELQIN